MTDRRQLLISTASLTLTIAVALAQPVEAQSRPLSRTKYTNGPSVRRVFSDVVTDANEWTVRVKSGDHVVAFGTVVRSDGFIVSKASQLSGDLVCRMADGRELPAEYIAYSSDHDIALLKVQADDLPVVQWQDGDDPSVGRWVITPDQQGAPNSIGVVSVGRRTIARVKEKAVLGIHMQIDMSPVVIKQVTEGGAAERASLHVGDIIHQVDDVEIVSPESLAYEISRHSPGDTVQLKIERDGADMAVRATLTHPFGEFQSRIAMQNHMGGDLSQRRTGFPAVIQHDTVLEPDECGGPLVDLSGRAIGINIARAGRTESYAIPDDIIRPLVDELIAGHYPPPGDQQPTIAIELSDEPSATTPESDTSGQ